MPLLVALTVGYRPVSPPSDAPYPVLPSPLVGPAATPLRSIDGRAPRVLILGDSIADQHGSHAAVPLREAGVEVRLATQWGSGLFTRDQYDMGSPRSTAAPGSLMAQASTMVAEFDPDVVVVYSNHNYWPPFPRDAAGQEIGEGTLAFTAMAQAQLRELDTRLTSSGARVYLVEPFPFRGIGPAQNPIWTSYLGLQAELGFGVIRAGQVLTTPDGQMLDVLADCAGASVRARPPAEDHLSYFGAGLMGTATARAVAGELDIDVAPQALVAPTEPPVALLPDGLGYRLVTCDGATFGFTPVGPNLLGTAATERRAAGDPVVAAATTALGRQGWTVTRSGVVLPLGGVRSFGDARLSGAEHVVGIASARDARGYWVATDTGAVQAFGLVRPLGDLAGTGDEVVAMASPPDRKGYWLLTASGRVEGFGSAQDFGDLRGRAPADPLVAIAAHPSGQGYWLLDRAGRVHPFGAARDLGSAAQQGLVRLDAWRAFGDFDSEAVPASAAPTQAVGLLPTMSGQGYWIALANGAVCHYGDAKADSGLHLTDVEVLQPLRHTPFYGAGPCSNRTDDDPFSSSVATRVLPDVSLLG